MNFLQLVANQRKLQNIEKVIGSDDLRKMQAEINAVANAFLNDNHPEYASYLHMINALLFQRSKEELEVLDAYEEHGRPVELVTNESIDLIIKKLKKETHLGFDSESKPVFEKGQIQSIDIIQIATKNICYIFQLNKLDYISKLETIIKNRNIKKIGVGLGSDIKFLKEDLQMKCEGFVDVNTIYEYLGRQNNIGSKQIVASALNKNIRKSKKVTVSNWAAKELSPAQLEYASDDAFSSLDAFIVLREIVREHEVYLSPKLIKILEL
jgi:ribonuclease D